MIYWNGIIDTTMPIHSNLKTFCCKHYAIAARTC